MTRGRPPKKAAAEALECARRRGGVLEIPDTTGLPFDLLIISPACIAFVKVMRMRARVQGPPDVLGKFGSVIRELRIVPESAVAMVELWVLSSHTTWQYFRVMPDRIVEMRSDGSTIDGTGQNAIGNTAASPNHACVPDLDGFHPHASSPGDGVSGVSSTKSET
jgi:hypothetical protein